MTMTKTKTKYFKDPTYAILLAVVSIYLQEVAQKSLQCQCQCQNNTLELAHHFLLIFEKSIFYKAKKSPARSGHSHYSLLESIS